MNDVTIVNIAFTQLGAENILSLDQDSENARRAKVIFEPLRDEVLRSHPWNFAIKRATLARLSDTPVLDYDYYHQLPVDCLRPLRISDGTNNIEDFEIEGRKIASNYDTLYIKYIKKETDPNQYDAMFIAALAGRIAAELAYPLTSGKQLAKTLYELYVIKKKSAKSIDAQESPKTDVVGDTAWTEDARS